MLVTSSTEVSELAVGRFVWRRLLYRHHFVLRKIGASASWVRTANRIRNCITWLLPPR